MPRLSICSKHISSVVLYFVIVYVVVVMVTLSYMGEEGTEDQDEYDSGPEIDDDGDDSVTRRIMDGLEQFEDSKLSSQVILGRNVMERLEKTTLLADSEVEVLGRRRPNKVFLTIGLPTMNRPNVGMDYFRRALESIVTKTDEDEKARTVVVVLIADLDLEYRFKVIDHITDIYQKHLNSGFIQVIQIAGSAYPPVAELPRKEKEGPLLLRWRAKQAADYAFLFYYARNISHYYLQLEDDVICTRSFVNLIDGFISEQRKSWFVLRFSELGFIGKLFKSSDLGRLAHFFLTFHQNLPVNTLYEHFAKLISLPFMPLRKPTLFQHIGEYSSLQLDDVQKLDMRRDRHFAGGGARDGDDDAAEEDSEVMGLLERLGPPSNPTADLHTTIPSYMNFTIERAYTLNPDINFWGTSPKIDDTIHIIFKSPLPLEAVSIDTGKLHENSDFLRSAELSASPFAVPKKKAASGAPLCYDYEPLGEFARGRIEVSGINEKLDMPIMCLMVRVTEKQKDWLIISQIHVWTVK